jgi:hypothetical protein
MGLTPLGIGVVDADGNIRELKPPMGTETGRLLPMRPPGTGLLEEMQRWEFRAMSDKEFLKSGKQGWTPKFRRIWVEEFARRFYVRPLKAQPNTQDGTTLVRAI